DDLDDEDWDDDSDDWDDDLDDEDWDDDSDDWDDDLDDEDWDDDFDEWDEDYGVDWNLVDQEYYYDKFLDNYTYAWAHEYIYKNGTIHCYVTKSSAAKGFNYTGNSNSTYNETDAEEDNETTETYYYMARCLIGAAYHWEASATDYLAENSFDYQYDSVAKQIDLFGNTDESVGDDLNSTSVAKDKMDIDKNIGVGENNSIWALFVVLILSILLII
ncbi:hypothetical protein, partial [Methanobrevibacter sp.]|uniref:hypothetical protein n=1 Tax=Methanobrevibacter sp. TaxID=66852 RepID=UPI00389047BB